ncbi:MAG: DUF742 domain-containing protein [Sciscionella sp.]
MARYWHPGVDAAVFLVAGEWDGPTAGLTVVVSTGGAVCTMVRSAGKSTWTHDLALETLISTTDAARSATRFARVEHRTICRLCVNSTSVAELAARLHLPLGVVRVLVADLAEVGLVIIHAETLVSSDRPSMELMERVLRGLRNI